MQVANPSQNVNAQLQNHVHLISSYRYPYCPNLTIEQAYQYLQDAPRIVKTHAPMQWHYVNAPQDGTCWLEWIADKNDQQYPSDGYAWFDSEHTYTQECNGYSIEVKVQTSGYRPNIDQHSQHARTRYRFVAKNPSISAAHPDPSLWIVNYHRADQSRVFPVAQIPVTPATQQVVAQRRYLESCGQLERKEFMLHDRDNWPVLNLPAASHMQQPGAYGMGAGAMARAQNRFPQPQLQQQANAHPHKRVRTQAPHQLPGAGEIPLETTIEEEEDTSRGDFFDHLTPRDISLARYTQHQRWMEEVFSSPYAISQIVPTSLGLGLMGELKGLTDGILEPPAADSPERADGGLTKVTQQQPFVNITKDQVEEFNKRVQKHLEEGQAEIERMKAEHAVKMQDWQKVKSLTLAEKKLRGANWKGHEDVGSFPIRFEQPVTNGHVEVEEHVEDIIKEVEDMLKVNIEGQDDCTRVAKGGLKERKLTQYEVERKSSPQEADLDIRNGAGQSKQSDDLGQGSAVNGSNQVNRSVTTGQNLNGSQSMVQSNAGLDRNQYPNAANQSDQHSSGHSNGMSTDMDNLPDLDMNDTLMDSMDLDVDTSGLNFDDLQGAELDDESRNSAPSQSAGNDLNAGQSATWSSSAGASHVTASNQGGKPGGATDDSVHESGAGNDALDDAAGDGDMFNDTFAGLDNLDGGDDDGLIDFNGGGMGMEDSAFGDALHGMETPDGTAGDGGTPMAG